MAELPQSRGWRLLRRWPRESSTRAVLVTLLICTFCSAVIATAVSVLQPYQERNRTQQRLVRIEEIIAAVPGLEEFTGALGSARVETRLVDLASGSYADVGDPLHFDAREAARNPETSEALAPERDVAGLGRRARHATVFLVREGGVLRLLVLPVSGAGYVSTLYGYLALDADLNTIRGLNFYEHSETPGLGSEVDNPQWRAQWPGKRLRDPAGVLRIEVARGPAASSGQDEAYRVDGISGATRTGIGVTNMLRFWVGPDGFGPYLERLQSEGGQP